MKYVITADRGILEKWQSQVDKTLGYSETPDRVTQVGAGPHVPVELCLAKHFAEISIDQTGKRFALPFHDAVPVPDGVTVGELPEDWYPKMEVGFV